MRASALLVASAIALPYALAQDYIVRNWCPEPIEWFIGADSQGTLPSGGGSALRLNLGPSPGYIYTTANGGIKNGQLVATRAGFFFEPNYWYYHIVRDPSSNNFNTGISITPSNLPNNGFCNTVACRDGNCTTAYRHHPVFNGGPPPANAPAPNPPSNQCKIPGTNFDITFCPTNNWPQARGAQVLANFNPKKCMDVQGNVLANGTPVQIYDCNDTNAQRWILNFGDTHVRLAGTQYCLDAGSTPGNGVAMKIWTCYDNLPAQEWELTPDFRIRLRGTGLCLDLPNGNTANGVDLQTWGCNTGNTNQAWGLPDHL